MRNINILLLFCVVALASCEALGLDDDGFDDAMADVRARTSAKEKEREEYLQLSAMYKDSAKYYQDLLVAENDAGKRYKYSTLEVDYYPYLSKAFDYKSQIAFCERSKLLAEGSVVANEHEGSTLFAIQARFEWEWGEWNEEIPDLEILAWGEEEQSKIYGEKLQDDRLFEEVSQLNMREVSSAYHYWKTAYAHLDPSHPSAKYPYSAYVLENFEYYAYRAIAVDDEVSRRRKEFKASLVEWRKEKEEARKKKSEEIKALEANGAKWGDD
jgi:hypothetical protein